MQEVKIIVVKYGMKHRTLATAIALLSFLPLDKANQHEVQNPADAFWEKSMKFMLDNDKERFPNKKAKHTTYSPFSHVWRGELQKHLTRWIHLI